MDLSKSIETLTESAETANEAAETALLASEGVIALSTRVSDEVRSAVQQALKSSAQPKQRFLDEQEAESASNSSSLLDKLPLVVSTLTLCGVGYLAMQNIMLTEQVEQQSETVARLEEQLQVSSAENMTQMMILADQGVRTEENVKVLEGKIGTIQPATPVDNSVQIAALEQLSQQVETLNGTIDKQSAQIEPITTAIATLAIQEKLAETEEAAVAPPAEAVASTVPTTTTPAPTPAITPVADAITIETLRTTLKEEITPLHNTLKSVETHISEQATRMTRQITKEANIDNGQRTVISKPKTKPKKSVKKYYRFP